MSYIHAMNLSALDLNLLVALDALVSEAHVGRAAVRIGLSQPATSHALRRLREIINDPLLVRVGPRMELTPRAQALRVPLALTLDHVRGLFEAEGFHPATSTRHFRLMMPDLVVDSVMPPLVERIGAQAPGVRLDITPWRGPQIMTPDFARSIDLVIACTGEAFPGFHRQRLYADTDAIAVRRGQPHAARLKRLEGFLQARHVAVVGPGEREDMIDTWLADQGLERRVVLVVPSYLQAMRMAARTDLVAFVPGRLIAALGDAFALQAVAPPIAPGMDEQFMFHPTWAHVDPGSMWLRKLVIGIGRELDRPKRRGA